MAMKKHTRLDLVEGGNIFKQGDYVTLGFIPRDYTGASVDLTNKQIEGSIFNGSTGVIYEGPASFVDGKIFFTIKQVLNDGKFQLEFTVTDAADQEYRTKFPTDDYASELTIKPSADNLDYVGVSMTTVAQLRTEQEQKQQQFELAIVPQVDELKQRVEEGIGAFTEDTEVKDARMDEINLRTFNQKVVAQLAGTEAEARRKKDPEDLSDRTLALVTGNGTINVLSVPQEKSVEYSKLNPYLQNKTVSDNLLYQAVWEQGSFSGSSKTATTVRLRSATPIPVDKNKPLHIKLHGFTDYQVTLRGYRGSELAPIYSTATYITVDTILKWSDVSNIDFVVKRIDGAAILPEEAKAFNFEVIQSDDLVNTNVRKTLNKKPIDLFPTLFENWTYGSIDGVNGSIAYDRSMIVTPDFIPVSVTGNILVEISGSRNLQIATFSGANQLKRIFDVSSTQIIHFNDTEKFHKLELSDPANTSVKYMMDFLNETDIKMSPVASKEPKKLRVASFNLGLFSKGTGRGLDNATNDIPAALIDTKRYLASMGCDYIGSQEYTEYFDRNQTIVADTELMGYLYPFMLYSYKPSGSKIFSKYELFDTTLRASFVNQATDDSGGTRYYQKAYIRLNGKVVCIINTHLTTVDYQVRVAQMQELIDLLANEEYAIITGDFNVLGDGGTNAPGSEYTGFLNSGYKMANYDYYGEFATHDTGKKLDNIIVTDNIQISNVQVVSDASVSDHYPIIADLLI
ncbi:hypothetical protein ON064_00680 [Planococcus sp. A6]|uniref:endonuclease/exonuclease/phosphatase family protein n=1 Tax=Planococcus sp. A6 TaxID=2992760 RepID=UPI00237C1E56|nr:endonuclease/exonuclease/phosphatase family protein [Planococcus sp. A6]MDE0581564.1 hypothetical protein [Planococcus sp. A6]